LACTTDIDGDPIGDPMFYGVNLNLAAQMVDLFFYLLRNPSAPPMTDHLSLMTFGAYSNRTFGPDMWYDAMFAMQSGTHDDGIDLSGMLLYLMLGKMFENGFGLYGGVDYTTGDDPTTADKYEGFNDLFYTGHKFRGAMDFFVAAPDQGLMDMFFGGKYAINNSWKAGGAFHIFSTVEDLNAAGDTALGNEVDLFVKYAEEDFSWQTGFSMFSASKDGGYFGADPDGQMWWYSMATVNY